MSTPSRVRDGFVGQTGDVTNARPPYPLAQVGDEPEDVKDRFRSVLRTARRAHTPRQREAAGLALARVVAAMPALEQARTVSLYAARGGEPPTGPLLELLARHGVRVLLPVLGSGLSRSWALYTGPDELVERAPGRPPEPPGPALPAEALSEADLVLVPALAVDTAGTRLGQGGGWYDRALEHVRPGVLVGAVLYPHEVYDASVQPLPFQEHDRPVDLAVTPEGWHDLRAGV